MIGETFRTSIEYDDEDNTLTAYYETICVDGVKTSEVTVSLDDLFPKHHKPFRDEIPIDICDTYKTWRE